MGRLRDCRDERDALRAEVQRLTAELDRVTAEYDICRGALAQLQQQLEVCDAKLARAEGELAITQQLLEDCIEVTEPPPPTSRAFAGLWGVDAPISEVEKYERLTGVRADYGRSRAGEGQFNDNSLWLHPQSKALLDAGLGCSLQIQPKMLTGPSGSSRVGVGVERILRGDFDDFILGKLQQWKPLPTGKTIPDEDVSEANIQQAPYESQPFLAGWNGTTCTRPMTPAEYAQLLRHLHGLKQVAGVRDRVYAMVSLTSGKWNSTSSSDGWSRPNMVRLLQPLLDDGVIDGIATDGYCGDGNRGGPGAYQWKSPTEIVSGVKIAARDLGCGWSVMETGCQVKADALMPDKRAWFRDWPAVVDDDCRWLFFNVGREQDADRTDFRPEVPAGALAGFDDMMTSLTS